MINLPELKRLCEEAVPDWDIDNDGILNYPEQVGEDEWEAVQLSEYIDGEANRKFIVESRTAIPELIDGIEKLVEYILSGETVVAYHNLPDWMKEMIG